LQFNTEAITASHAGRYRWSRKMAREVIIRHFGEGRNPVSSII